VFFNSLDPFWYFCSCVSSQPRTKLFSSITHMESDRDQLVAQARAAETPEQIKVAKVALKRWQASRPNDPATNTLLVQLSMREAWLRIKREWD
jgi:hypothetical protein